eukprot:365663-Chlamydomonas_euryale.AAC.21
MRQCTGSTPSQRLAASTVVVLLRVERRCNAMRCAPGRSGWRPVPHEWRSGWPPPSRCARDVVATFGEGSSRDDFPPAPVTRSLGVGAQQLARAASHGKPPRAARARGCVGAHRGLPSNARGCDFRGLDGRQFKGGWGDVESHGASSQLVGEKLARRGDAATGRARLLVARRGRSRPTLLGCQLLARRARANSARCPDSTTGHMRRAAAGCWPARL